MKIKGVANLTIPDALFEGVDVTLSNVSVSEVVFKLTPMENRCCHCHTTFNVDDRSEEKVALCSLTSVSPTAVTFNNANVFIVHKKCLEDFVITYLNATLSTKTEES